MFFILLLWLTCRRLCKGTSFVKLLCVNNLAQLGTEPVRNSAEGFKTRAWNSNEVPLEVGQQTFICKVRLCVMILVFGLITCISKQSANKRNPCISCHLVDVDMLEVWVVVVGNSWRPHS